MEQPFMKPGELFRRYQDLQRYVGWTESDAARVSSLAPILGTRLEPLIDDFYAEIERHPEAARVITGGREQVERLKGTLIQWLRELLAGRYDEAYVVRRWRVGYRHVEIGLDQVYTNVALSRLRSGLIQAILETVGNGETADAAICSLNKLIDLDLAIIEDAYQAEYMLRQQRVERLAAIGRVAGGIAHELRNPLNVIRTSVYYLLNARNPTAEKTAEHLARIEAQVGLANNVITALSSFAKMPTPDHRPFAIGQCIREAVEMNHLPENIELSLEIAQSLPPALADSNQILIVLGNLIRNARDAMSNGGQLAISARAVDDAIEVDVADTGEGIAQENLQRILEPFFSTKARGIGLGLPISVAVLQRNHGVLTVSSELGRGTTFTLRLAAATDGAPK
jgi:two-component system, NtrC family, sensor kinase